MTLRRSHIHLSYLSAIIGISLSGCKGTTSPTLVAGPSPIPQLCGKLAPGTTPSLPTQIGSNQVQLNCNSWQAFIALNWQADPTKPGFPNPNAPWASFGTPGDVTPTVWESYLEAANVFGNSGTLKGLWQAKRPAIKSLVRTAKLGTLDLSDITQAGGGHHWLTSQRGDITYYEIMMNQDEYEFITQAGFDLTTSAGQQSCASQPGKAISDGPPPPPSAPKRGGFNLPLGNVAQGWDDTDCAGNIVKFGQGVGAMEIKAAWTPLPADHSLDYRYKTAQAEIVDPVTKKVRTVTVGLVGLHIARKIFPKAPWVWATFEQIDNTPDEAANGGFSAPTLPANPNQKPTLAYSFFNPKCTPATDPTYQCKHNVPPVRCEPGTAGTSAKPCDPYDKPMQITRLNPVDATANSVTAYVWGLLPPKSVFNYYRLINVQWPQAPLPSPPPGPGLRVPLTQGNPMPQGGAGGVTQIVANTTMESFQQSSNSCLDCHSFASISPGKSLQGEVRKVAKTGANAPAPYASDYSFIFLAETKK